MSILIKGMEMPKNCHECAFGKYEVCGINAAIEGDNTVTNSCPLIEVPPHGRLIDADALTDANESTEWYHQAPNKEMVHGANSAEHQAWYKEQDIYSAIDNAPTIIPASEEAET